ncbi:hypothetical protein TYRP_021523 [Tyrophagus putrescentiae]|nr:hypothetical protein TYRP_021523 [Tyrophagus putrescentiae]
MAWPLMVSSSAMIPVIRSSEDLRVLCEYTSRTLNMPQLNYAAAIGGRPPRPTRPEDGVADAEAVVAQARGRFERLQGSPLAAAAAQQERAPQAFGEEQPL